MSQKVTLCIETQNVSKKKGEMLKGERHYERNGKARQICS